MGVNYLVENLEKGTYELEFQAKEYGYGKLIKEYDLLSTTLEQQDNDLKLGIDYNDYLDENFIRVLIIDSYHGSEDLDLLKDRNTGMALSVLNEDKEIELSKAIAIGAYSIGGKDNTTSSLNIDENYKVSDHNKSDLIIFLKLNKLS
jgi:hypothetical protein